MRIDATNYISYPSELVVGPNPGYFALLLTKARYNRQATLLPHTFFAVCWKYHAIECQDCLIFVERITWRYRMRRVCRDIRH